MGMRSRAGSGNGSSSSSSGSGSSKLATLQRVPTFGFWPRCRLVLQCRSRSSLKIVEPLKSLYASKLIPNPQTTATPATKWTTHSEARHEKAKEMKHGSCGCINYRVCTGCLLANHTKYSTLVCHHSHSLV